MNDRRKTKAQLIEELQQLRVRLAQVDERRITEPEPKATESDVLSCYASQGVWVVDTDFIIRVANETMCRLLDKPADEVVGRKCYEMMNGPNCHSQQCAMRRAFAGADTVTAEETRKPFGRVPLACRVVAHLVHDRSQEASGIVEQVENAPTAAESVPAHAPEPIAAKSSRPISLPAIRQLAETALDVAASLRHRLPDDELAISDIAKLEAALAPFRDSTKALAGDRVERDGKPELRELASSRSVLIVAPPTSCIWGAWSDVVRRAGYVLRNAADEPQVATQDPPTVAILDLALGEPIADDLHQRLRQEHPHAPIFVVSSADTDSLEARRWRRPHTWYVPRTIDGDELVRLIEDITPRPALRSRSER